MMNEHHLLNKQLNILHVNTQSITKAHKKIALELLIYNTKSSIISLNETFLKSKHKFKLSNFSIYREDRKRKKGGGVLIGVNTNLKHQKLNIQTHPNTVDEITGIKLYLQKNTSINIFSYYSPPNSDLDEAALTQCMALDPNFIIV